MIKWFKLKLTIKTLVKKTLIKIKKRYIDKMKYLAAYCLAALGGKDAPTTFDVKAILESVGVDVDDAKLKTVMDALDGKNLTDVFNKHYFCWQFLGYQFWYG